MPIDTSMYGNINPPQNPLSLYGTVIGLQNQQQENKLLQTQNKQNQLNLQNSQYQQQALGILNDHRNPDGTINYSEAGVDPRGQNNPYWIKTLQDSMDNNYKQLPVTIQQGGIPGTSYQTQQGYRQQVFNGGTSSNNPTQPANQTPNSSSKVSQNSSDSMTPFVPEGYKSPLEYNTQEYNSVQDAASPQKVTAYKEVINGLKNGATSGTALTALVNKAAQYAPAGTFDSLTSDGAKNQALFKWLNNATSVSEEGKSDMQLQHAIESSPNPAQLTATLKELAPNFLAQVQGLSAKANYYQKATNNGKNMDAVSDARSQWRNNWDSRLLEYSNLPQDKATRGDFLAKHPDLIPDLKTKYPNLQTMGVTGNVQ